MNNKLGIFWIYDNQIFYKTQSLKEIKSINGFKDSDLSHYSVWDEVKNQHPKFYLYEYEDIPRGRVVFDVKNLKFIIYCNKYLLNDKNAIKFISKVFSLEDMNIDIVEDEHYYIRGLTKNL